MNAILLRMSLVLASAVLVVSIGFVAAADQPTVRATLEPAKDRKPAPNFSLEDSSGKTVQLKQYLGKVIVLDFWTTWCTGCKKEIPWFAKLQRTYGDKQLAVIGVSLDEGGWKVVKPFLADTNVPYLILLGDDATARQFGITNLPDTFLIDQKGRVAAVYRAGLVDIADVEANIRALLAQP